MTPRESSYRRESDPEDSDPRVRRSHGGHREEAGSLQKWITGVVAAGIITSLTILIARDRTSIDDRLSDQKQALVGLMALSTQREQRTVVLETNQTHILAALQRIEDKQDRILKVAK